MVVSVTHKDEKNHGRRERTTEEKQRKSNGGKGTMKDHK
jgi:hypothetical protein